MAPQKSASSPTPTAQLWRVSHAQNSESGRLIIAAIVLGCLIFVVILVAVVVPLVRRRFYKRVSNTKTMANVNESQERVTVPQKYRKGHRPTQSEIVGMMPLLANPPNRLSVIPEEKSAYMSTTSRERKMSAFVNANDEGVVKEFDPNDLSRSSVRGSPILLPTAPQLFAPIIPGSTVRAFSPPPRLPPLIIPGLNDLPASKPSREPSTRSAAESDDSASIYSQASASTYSTYRVNVFPFSASSIPPVPALPDYVKSQSAGLRPLTLTHFPFLPSSSSTSFTEVPIPSPDDETTLTRGDTLVVGRLLKSRAWDAAPPSRSSSQVSHIERSGSIKPVIFEEEEEQYGPRYRIKNRVGRRKMRIKENIGPKPPMGTLTELSSPDRSEPPTSPPRTFDGDGSLVDGVAPPLEADAFYTETAPLNIAGAKEKARASSEWW